MAPFLSERNSAGDRQVMADDLKGDWSNGEDWPDETARPSSPTDRLCWAVLELFTSVKSYGFFFIYLQTVYV